MAVTQAQFQTVIAFARTNRMDPEDMCALLELAMMSPFIDPSSNIQMVALTAGVDGVQITLALENALKLLEYFSQKANGGIVAQKIEFTLPERLPGQQP